MNMMRTLLLSLLVLARTGATSVELAKYFGGSNNIEYLNWAASVNYESSQFFASDTDPSDGVAVHWTISQPYVELGVAVRASGWLGFGISDNGGMTGSDMFIFEANTPRAVVDAYVGESRYPQIDHCQDWEFVDSSTDGDFLIVQVRRKLVTGDTAHDLPIRDDAEYALPLQKIIAAWGDSSSIGYHGLRRARGTIRWYNFGFLSDSEFRDIMRVEASSSLFVGANNYRVSKLETVYHLFCVTATDALKQGVDMDRGITVVGFEPVASKFVHHMVAHGGTDENPKQKDSQDMNGLEVIFVWAPGTPQFALPYNVGLPIGGKSGYRRVCVQIHYNNPSHKKGQVDNSGIKFHYRIVPRQHDFGVLQLGDPFVHLAGRKVGDGLAQHTFECSSACSATALTDEPVTVLYEGLHMHGSGASAYNQQFRNGQLIRTGRAEYYEFDQQSVHLVVQEPFQVFPGDSFRTTCAYSNFDVKGRRFGHQSSDEMCIAYLFYYPRKLNAGSSLSWYCGHGFSHNDDCDAKWTTGTLSDVSGLNRTFARATTSCTYA